MRTNKTKLKAPRLRDVYQAIGEQDVLKLRNQLKSTYNSMSKEIRNNQGRENTTN